MSVPHGQVETDRIYQQAWYIISHIAIESRIRHAKNSFQMVISKTRERIWIIRRPSGKCWDSKLRKTMTASFHIHLNSSFINHPSIRRCKICSWKIVQKKKQSIDHTTDFVVIQLEESTLLMPKSTQRPTQNPEPFKLIYFLKINFLFNTIQSSKFPHLNRFHNQIYVCTSFSSHSYDLLHLIIGLPIIT